MKAIFKTTTIVALVLTTSCGKDATKEVAEFFDEETEQLESTPLEANSVSDNVIITGGTKMEGESPSPNGVISLDLSETSKSAFLDIGFDILFSSDSDVVGAYLRFKAEDGIAADNYYDINLESNSLENKSARKAKMRSKKSLTAKTDEDYLDVDFNSNIQPGKFCYEICVYDEEGNISEPQEVCLKVESWGGYEAAVGEWKFEKWYRETDPTLVYLPDTDNCVVNDSRSLFCADGQLEVKVSSKWCLRQDYMELTLNADGTYIEREQETIKDSILSVISPEQITLENIDLICSENLLGGTDVSGYEGNGKWAYLADEDKLVFIEYDYQEIVKGEVYSELEDGEEPYPYYGFGGYEGEVKIIDGKLIISAFEDLTVHYKK